MLILYFRLFLFTYSYGLPYIVLNIIGLEAGVCNKNLILSSFILFIFYNSILNKMIDYLKK